MATSNRVDTAHSTVVGYVYVFDESIATIAPISAISSIATIATIVMAEPDE